MDNLDIKENIDLSLANNGQEQTSFLKSSLGNVINSAIDTGLRVILPDFIENDVIHIKDTLVNQGLPEAISETIEKATQLGKNVLGIVTGSFDSISQAENAVEKGGLIDGISNVLDKTLDAVKNLNIIPETVINLIKGGKDILLNNTTEEIKNEFDTQIKNVEKIEKYNKEWKEGFNNKDIETMDKYMKKIKNTLEKIMPLEQIISEARKIENLHELIKNNGGNFELTDEEKELAAALS